MFEDYGIYFAPHRFCVSNDPMVITMHVVADSLIALSYFAIPLLIVLDSWKYRFQSTAELRSLLLHAAAFIVSCGITHVLAVINWWKPYYMLSGAVALMCALVSTTFIYRAWRYLKNNPLHTGKLKLPPE